MKSLAPAASTNLVQDGIVYVKRMGQFSTEDWIAYVLWIGLMMGLLVSVTGFILMGYSHGVQYPAYVWNIPVGTFIFVGAIAVDTIGHRTVYKEVLKKGEALVHHITIFAGITSVVGLCLAYNHPDFMRIPSLVLIILSMVYSLIDEGLHWHRYMNQNSDRFEMWSHFFILVGHTTMILAWWHWFSEGYPGVKETLQVLGS
jgi:hypothetical protein